MGWRDELVTASIGGVPVKVLATNRKGGRRGPLRQFFGLDEPHKDDTGRSADTFDLTAFAIGENYLDERDALEEVLRGGGTMELVLPWRKSADVRLSGEYTVSETSREGGYAEFTIPLVEHYKFGITVTVDTGSKLKKAAFDADRAIADDFGDKMKLGDLLKDGFNRVKRGMSAANTALLVAKGKISAKMNMIDNLANQIAQFSRNLDSLLALPGQLIADFVAIANLVTSIASKAADQASPVETLTTATDQLGGLSGAAAASSTGFVRRIGTAPPTDGERVEAAMLGTRAMADVSASEALTGQREDLDAVPATPGRKAEKNARKAVELAAKATMAIAATRVLADLRFESADQASAVVRELGGTLDTLAASASDDVYLALTSLRATLQEHARETAAQTPQVGAFTPRGSVPMLVTAHELYGDPFRADEIAARNRTPNPLMVGTSPLEVLL